MRILLTGDSLGLPRPYDVRNFDAKKEKELAVSFNDTYGYILHKELQKKFPHEDIYVINRCQRAYTIKEVKAYLFDHLYYFQADVLIMQVGICDCIPREELQGKPKVNLEEFMNNFIDIILSIKEKSNVKLIIIGISPVSEKIEQKFGGLINEIKKYNKVFKSVVDNKQIFYIDMEKYINSVEQYTYLHTDGYHINKNGNMLVFNKLMMIIESFLNEINGERQEVLLYKAETMDDDDRLILGNILHVLFINKIYKDILLYKEIDLPVIHFYVGRAYKFLNQYSHAIIYLKKYIQKIEEGDIDDKIFCVDFKQLLISAFFHLGEIYYIQSDKKNARIYFEKCRNMSKEGHSMAETYLEELDLS